MTPDVCTVTVSTLPTTGADVPWWIIGVGFFVILAGAIGLLAAGRQRSGRRGSAPVSGAALLLVAAIAIGAPVLTAQPAQAATPEVEYGSGCTLISIDRIDAVDATEMLPGDEQLVLTAQVTNQFSGPVTISADTILANPGAFTTTTRIGGALSQPVTLTSGETTTVTVLITLPAETANEYQHTMSGLTLTITGAEA